MVMGINSRKQLSVAEGVMRQRILDKLMDAGVTIMDPASTFIEASVKIGRDTVIYPYTWLEGTTEIGEDCEIGPNARFTNVKIGDDNHLQFIYGHDCEVKNHVTAGPYVHLRPDTVISDHVKIGNYVEVKNSNVGEGTKLPHLTYIGDSDIGSGVNMGCAASPSTTTARRSTALLSVTMPLSAATPTLLLLLLYRPTPTSVQAALSPRKYPKMLWALHVPVRKISKAGPKNTVTRVNKLL